MRTSVTITCLLLLLFYQTIALSVKSDFDVIKDRVTLNLLQVPIDDGHVLELVNTLQDDGTWPGINYEDVSREGFEHRNHLSNMVELARAYKTKSCKYHKSKKVKSTIELALKNWTDHDYICDNWWHNQIGTPNALVTLMLIYGDQLPGELVEKAQPIIGRAHIDAPGARPGGDRIKIAGIQAKNMLFIGDKGTFDQVVRVIENEIKQVPWIGDEFGYSFKRVETGFSNRTAYGRGIQYDYSFHHRADGVNNTLSYGLGYANAFVEWAVYTSGTTYAFSDEKLDKLIDYFLDGICKTAIYGKFPDPGAKNRSISREGTLKAYNAETAENLLITSDYRSSELQEIADIRNKGTKPTLSHATFYWNSEHFSFQRPDFFTSVRMFSTRTYNMEVPYNSEGLLNHHRGDGTNHISRTGDEYFDIAPVYDYQKIPGTTVIQKSQLPSEKEIQKLGLTSFAGATTDGRYGAAAFDFRSPHDPLVARKAWFFFDGQYVCLGAGISTRKELPVVTTLNQCLLRDEVTIASGSETKVIEKGEEQYDDVRWAFQDGIGYIFPEPSTVHIKNNAATGSWWRINKQSDSPKDELSLDVFKLWLDHGKAPVDATYAYIIAPAVSINQLETMASSPEVKILANTPEIQAVMHEGLQMYQLVFYKSGEIALRDGLIVKAHTPGILVLNFDGDRLKKLAVSDPNRELGRFQFSLSGQVSSDSESVRAVWNEKTKSSDLSVLLPEGVYAGSSVSIVFD
jgi:chondroitin AC lyase